ENGNHVDHPNFSSIDTRLLQCLDTVTKRSRNEYGSINSIFRDETNRIIEEDYSIDEIATKMPKFENVKDKLYKARNKDIPTLPKNIQHVDLTSERYSNTKYKTRFLLFDTNDKERIIAYASDNQLQILSKSQRWHIDGTFKCFQFYNQGPRTNNHVEGFHRKIDIDLPQSHPNLYLFVEYMKKLEAETTLNFKRRQFKNDFRKCRLQTELNNLQQNKYFNFHLPQLLGYYLSKFAYLYQYKSDVNEKSIENSVPAITTKISTYKTIVDQTFQNFTAISNFGINLTSVDMDRLKPRTWLNDNLINYYLHLLVWYNKINAFNFESYFYSTLSTRGCLNVKNWFRGVNIFQFDLILIPINMGNHWILATIENFKCKVTVYDSFKHNQNSVLDNLRFYLEMKYREQYNVSLTPHRVFYQEQNIPLQTNTYDCGVFLCKFAYTKSLNSNSFNFLAREMDYYRKNILISIVLNKII
ncbi:unnamed protein product, partial [Brachionus calyciflorus]